MNETRQPKLIATAPTIGPASAPPSGVPELATPAALACSRRGNHSLTILLAAEPNGPSPMPKMVRTTSSAGMVVANAVSPQKMDHTLIDSVNTFLPPIRSAAKPPTNENSA